MTRSGAGMAAEASGTTGVKAVLLDVLGTLLELEAPVPRLRAELRRSIGLELSEDEVAAAFRAEATYYVEHHLEGRDADSLADLRGRCAAVVAEALGRGGVDAEAVREPLLRAIRFRPWPDALETLRELRRHDVTLVAVSNWDCSLPDVLAGAGLGALLDATVPSAVADAAKPDPAPFRAALGAAGCEANEAIHVGDSVDNDVAGARASGIEPVLLVRGDSAPPPGVRTIATLAELPALIGRPPGGGL